MQAVPLRIVADLSYRTCSVFVTPVITRPRNLIDVATLRFTGREAVPLEMMIFINVSPVFRQHMSTSYL